MTQAETLPGLKLPDEPQLVEMVRANSNPTFTGEVAVKDFERARGIVESLLIGRGVVATAKQWGCSTRTVHNIVKILRERGELKPISDHIIERLEETITVGLEVWTEALEQGKISPGSIPIPLLAAIDKRSQLQAGVVLGTGRTSTEITAADVHAAFKLLKPAGPGVDTQSTGLPHNALAINGSASLDAALDTAQPVAEPVTPDPVTFPAAAPDTRGGGRRLARGGGKGVGFPRGYTPNKRISWKISTSLQRTRRGAWACRRTRWTPSGPASRRGLTIRIKAAASPTQRRALKRSLRSSSLSPLSSPHRLQKRARRS